MTYVDTKGRHRPFIGVEFSDRLKPCGCVRSAMVVWSLNLFSFVIYRVMMS